MISGTELTGWTERSIAAVSAAVSDAPSVHNTQPWTLRYGEGAVCLAERLDLAVPHHDPTGRDRVISCGAALANLVLAVRVLGWRPEVTIMTDHAVPDTLARVVLAGLYPPSRVDLDRYAAIAVRHSYRAPFARTPVSTGLRRDLVQATDASGVQVLPLVGPEQAAMLARMLGHAALTLRADAGYQRELTAWLGGDDLAGLARRSVGHPTLPSAGLVRPGTALPDSRTLAARLRQETVLLFQTPDDGRHDHLAAGRALQETWLAATHAGLVASVITQPFHLAEVRAGLIERLDLAGFPQALLRVGYPTQAAPVSSPERDLGITHHHKEDPS